MFFEADGVRIDIDDDIDKKASDVPEVKETAFSVANRVAEIARGTAPALSGDYKSGIGVQKTKRGARVFASDYKSAWIEFGVPSRGIPAKFNLRNAAKAAGLKFRKKR